MTDLEFNKFQKLIYDEFGNYIGEDKKTTLDIKINKIINKFHPEIKSISDYYKILTSSNKNSEYWQHFTDYITVHKTNFFRENEHFEYIKNNIEEIVALPSISQNKEIRVWCAAASTGEEPYSILMTLNECLPRGINIKFLATDISELVLSKAIKGRYSEKSTRMDVPDSLFQTYFDSNGDETCTVKENFKQKVVFRKFNLVEPFNFKNKFDIIFCRNVMIYFDMPTKKNVISKMTNLLNDNGILIVGLAESLGNDMGNLESLKYSIYRKKDI